MGICIKFFLIIFGFFLYIPMCFSASSGFCPQGGVGLCRKSLEGAVATLLDCPENDSETIECGRIFTSTLSEVDDRAPFFEDMYDKQNYMGDQENYRNVIDQMKQNDQDPESLIALYNFAKAILLQQANFNTLNPEQIVRLSSLLNPFFLDREFRPLEQSDAHHRKDFIQHCKDQARFIVWPDTPTGRETSRIMIG